MHWGRAPAAATLAPRVTEHDPEQSFLLASRHCREEATGGPGGCRLWGFCLLLAGLTLLVCLLGAAAVRRRAEVAAASAGGLLNGRAVLAPSEQLEVIKGIDERYRLEAGAFENEDQPEYVKLVELDMRPWNCGDNCPQGGCCLEYDCFAVCEKVALCAIPQWTASEMHCTLLKRNLFIAPQTPAPAVPTTTQAFAAPLPAPEAQMPELSGPEATLAPSSDPGDGQPQMPEPGAALEPAPESEAEAPAEAPAETTAEATPEAPPEALQPWPETRRWPAVEPGPEAPAAPVPPEPAAALGQERVPPPLLVEPTPAPWLPTTDIDPGTADRPILEPTLMPQRPAAPTPGPNAPPWLGSTETPTSVLVPTSTAESVQPATTQRIVPPWLDDSAWPTQPPLRSSTARPSATIVAESPLTGGCSNPGDDCRSTHKCCKEGTQCYSKNQFYAGCQAVCKKRLGWECKELGVRAPSFTDGTWAGEDCSLTRKCNNADCRCIRKNAFEAYCTKDNPKGWNGQVIGGPRLEYAVQPAEDWEASGTSLYCFMAVLPGSAEEALNFAARDRGASIYQCDAHAVFPSEGSAFVHVGTWNSFANTDAFVRIWDRVKGEGSYVKYDWTVKVDPDCVFMPFRLKYHLKQLHAPKNKPVYIKNTNIDFGFLGAVEIINRMAAINYLNNLLNCRRTMGGTSGEDGFLKGCLDAVGVGFMLDASILKEPHDVGACTDQSRVAFHPRKDAQGWVNCYNAAAR